MSASGCEKWTCYRFSEIRQQISKHARPLFHPCTHRLELVRAPHQSFLLTRLTREDRCSIIISAPIQETLRGSDGVGVTTSDVAGDVARMCKRIGRCAGCESQPHCFSAIDDSSRVGQLARDV